MTDLRILVDETDLLARREIRDLPAQLSALAFSAPSRCGVARRTYILRGPPPQD